MAKESYTLNYFPAYGRGEIIRLTLSVAGQKFEDNRIPSEQWPEVKNNQPMKQLPSLTVRQGETETVYCQSGAICKYLAKKYGLYGSPDQELLIDEVYDSCMDIHKDIVGRVFAPEDKKSELKKKFEEEALPRFSEYFKLRQSKYGKNGYLIGAKLTLADIAVFNIVNQAENQELTGQLNNFKELSEHYEKMKKEKAVAEWLKARPTCKF